jgi:hypothetical protein
VSLLTAISEVQVFVLGDKRVLENKFGATNDYPEIINDLMI